MRTLSVLFLLAIGGRIAAFDQPPTLTTGKVEKGNLVIEMTRYVVEAREIVVKEVVDGKAVDVKKVVTVQVPVQERVAHSLKGVTVTRGGKAVRPKALEELIAEDTTIVTSNGPLAEKYKKLFKDDVFIFEFPAPDAAPKKK